MSNLREKIEEVLEKKIRPALAMHGGGVEIADVDENAGSATVSFSGMCEGCPAGGMTFYGLIEAELKSAIPELKEIKLAGGGQFEPEDV